MRHTQKYCLVSFIHPVLPDTEFSMEDWPLHVTLGDVFAINLQQTGIESKLTKLLSEQPTIKTVAHQEATLGTTKVVVLEKSDELSILHLHLIDLLEKNGAKFNTPEFTREGFIPHSTLQKSERLYDGDELTISNVALVDMFPEDNWQQRKVIKIFELQSKRP
jgi:hypothetical protein